MGMTSPSMPRSPELMQRGDTALLVVDVQEKLLPLIAGAARITWNIARLIEGAKTLGLPVLASEQYPRGLGSTVEDLKARLPQAAAEKTAFSCRDCPDLFANLAEQGVYKVLITGIEAHVCVQQTALDLVADGFRVYVAVDAVGSRYPLDCATALRRLESAGVTLTTTESALFEWCERSGTPEFKQISALVKQPTPEA